MKHLSIDEIAAVISLATGIGMFLFGSHFLWPHSTRGPAHGVRPRPINILFRRLRERLDAAGFARVAPGSFIAGSMAFSLGLVVTLLLITPVTALAVCAGIVGALAPLGFLSVRRSRLARARALLWPDVVDTLISSIRSGCSIVEAVVYLGSVMPSTISSATLRFGDRVSTSAHVGLCLDELKADWSDAAGDRIVEALKVTRDLGGTRLTAVLRELSSSLRKNLAVTREIEARQSWIRVAAGIGAAAPWVVVLLLSTRPEAAQAYQSPAGAVIIFGGLCLTAVAYRVMTRIGKVSIERRWFA
jgi:tight adherence protein B